ncbi:EAL domain-containing protein [Parasulfitobacter algicola]|uniref:EAL domain-containing protein n=1 Tax=Parasulfitobacter algicola TaxID=2614809 RepID=A0ABX2IU79_9RHOB|nr:EAL domain-containing protein [Sulfitobacter algicola]NSX53841.1 EAL domain-containing protein [Sulfitobacter algicola]
MSNKNKPGKSMDAAQSPLDFALGQRDNATLHMVKNALQHKEAMLAYQPVVLANDPGQIAFYEGLIRVLDSTGRTIPAGEFMPLVETHELGRMIDCLALEMGLNALLAEPSIRLSINMSARSIGYMRWMRTLENGLREDETIAERLILEITEASAMMMPEVVISFMDELQQKGVCFALDDFGAGYTAFRYLNEFFFDILKIDGQFIRGIHANPDNQVLVRALISIGRQFEMFTVAESVEGPRDAAFLRQAGIDCVQGYHLGAPTTSPVWRQDGKIKQRA